MPVGLEWLQIPDPAGTRSPVIPTMVMYPTDAPEEVVRLGPFALSAAPGAPLAPGQRRLVLISHGSGGAPATHRELARHLADCGFLVGVPEHPGNHRSDNALADDVALLAERPRQLRVVADALLAQFADALAPSYAIIGHSIGGYTALALAGGRPLSLPHQHADRQEHAIAVDHDDRVRALVLLAPATPWFRQRGTLAGVRVPILMIASYLDLAAPYFYMCEAVRDGVADPARVDYRLVEGAGHYSFLSPWPPELQGPAIPPSQDPPGFHRRAFLDQLYPQISGFLR